MTDTNSASTSDKPSKRPEWTKTLIIPVLVTVIGGLLVAVTTPAGSAVREVFFPTRVALSGIVESGGSPVGSASVRVDDHGPNGNTDETGRFQLADVDNGNHNLHVEAAGIQSHIHKFALASGAPATDLGVIKVEPYLRLGYFASVKPPSGPSSDPKVKYDVTLWLFGGDEALRTVQEVAYTRPAPLPRDQVRGADLARSFCYRVRGSVRFSDLMVLGGAFAAAQANVRLTDGRSFSVVAVPGAEQPPDCRSAKGPDADDLPEPVPVPVPGTPQIPQPHPNPKPDQGPVKVSIPDVAGMTEAAAEEELKDAGFKPQTRREQDAATPNGQAISTVPPAGTKKAKGAGVVLIVSTGPPTGCDPQIVPNVLGKTEQQAKALLECAGFTVEVFDGTGDAAKGTVVGQAPSAGESVEPGTQVNIKVDGD
jgi:hypothetical protein